MKLKSNPLLYTDFYKVGHVFQYPEGTQYVYSNLTARKSRLENIDETVFFGLQYFIKEYLIDNFNENFFNRTKEDVLKEYRRRILTSLGADLPTYEHIEQLHDLGYLPIKIKALPEGSLVPIKVPYLTIVNTLPEFYWLTNFIESLMSAIIWQPIVSATIANEYKKKLSKYAERTGMPLEFVNFQGHDFSFRGMSSLESAVTSGMAHLLSFSGTDTIPAIDALEQYYNADSDKEFVGGSIAATEHSVMCAGEKDGEFDTFKRLITEVYPNGFVSIVSDTWDLWKVLTQFLPDLKEDILKRDGKVVIRPDSGNPVDIICGLEGVHGTYEKYNNWRSRLVKEEQDKYFIPESTYKGVIELLWDVFGGTINEKGYKVLDPHIGAIYGDSITLARAEEICKRLEEKGFASQCVFGIGSYTYQYNTRDTFGTAMKATYVEINGKGHEIFKNPITDDGTKKSATGLLQVKMDVSGTKFILIDKVNKSDEVNSQLKTVFENGELVHEYSLSEIRKRLENYRNLRKND